MTTNYLQALNIGSGLNTTEIVDAIVAAKRVPKETMINKQIETREVQVSSLSEIKSSLSSFQTNLSLYSGINGLALGNNGTSVVATITNADQAGEFSHDIEVSSLATSQTLSFDGFPSASANIGTGSLAFEFGTWSGGSFTGNGTSQPVTITTGNDTLEGIAASINDADMGVTASVVQKSDNDFALVIRSSTGLDNAMRISVTPVDVNEDLDELDFSSYNGAKEVAAAADASLTLDGVSVTRNSNSITDLVDGVTLSLSSTTSSAETISASYDTDTALLAAEGFVAELNAVITLLRSKSARGNETQAKGDLPGDPLVRSMINQINSITSEEIVGFGDDPVYLANYGVMTNRDGSISVNAAMFRKAYEANPDEFNAILNSRVTTGSSLVSGTVSGSDYTPGSYAFAVAGNAASVDGNAMTFSDDEYSIATGNANGLVVELSGSGANTTIYMGRSLLDKLDAFVETSLSYGNDIDERISEYNNDISDYTSSLIEFQTQIDALRTQYTNQFAAMDAAVANLNKTKESLTMMMDGWKAMNSR